MGTRGIDDAADHIAAVFRELGLKPAEGADGYFEPFTIPGERRLETGATLSFGLTDGASAGAALGTDFSPLNVGGSADLVGVPIVFAGYGIAADDEGRRIQYDDYEGVDVEGKAVLIFRREPSTSDPKSGFHGEATTTYANFTNKAVEAARRGAKAILMVNDLASAEGGDDLLGFDGTPRGGVVPFVMISRALADKALAAAEQPSLEALQGKIDESLEPQSRVLEGVTLSANYEIDAGPIAVKNVVGVLEGAGPLADETIVVGAHYDHLGSGGFGSLAFGSHEIHNGADDNASGTSLVLELARRLAHRPEPLPRRVVFMLFSAEERGLLGSEYYVDHPLYPIDQTAAMVNFDMVGRLNEGP